MSRRGALNAAIRGAGREAVASALPEAIDLCEEDLEPQIEALAAEVEMSCDIRDLIEEGG